ncbi:MAG: hypothetical protein HC908_15400 [Calothrix sp. SM1_7_51]|nr:hypothetical protein [Calothrix sp. SM1_7_51]
MRLYHLLLAIIVLALAPLGFQYLNPNFGGQNSSTKSQTKRVNSSNQTSENTWKKILGKTTAPKGWNVAPCDGNTPLLCVSSVKGDRLGTVELKIYPLDKQADFQKMLTDASVPGDLPVDYKKYRTQVSKALKTWVDNYRTNLEKGSLASYLKEVSFFPPQQVNIGQIPAVSYGFARIKETGGVTEQYFGYVAFDGSQLYVISTAFNSASQRGKFDKLENLSVFQPYFSVIAADLKLP